MNKIQVNKKTMGLIGATMIGIGALGATATYASTSNLWGSYIETGINKIYSILFPEIEQKTQEKGDEINSKIVNDIKRNVTEVNGGMIEHKNKLIQQNVEELDRYYNETVEEAETTANGLTEAKKAELTDKANQELEKAKEKINKTIEQELKKLIEE